jgi:hypothetical protein
MIPEEFIDKRSRNERAERQAAQQHFIDLRRVLGEPPSSLAARPSRRQPSDNIKYGLALQERMTIEVVGELRDRRHVRR